ncbi:run domain Beclin-1-interacting and cysteine-rich domain-containing protein [Drosophila tropicalis]|uniref:run domain Beclin-1-interacting and cysteine-rich domain-containing protein n=1 Tax=Drosophila tropicalis TaxID=46794 RepID=UPI0035ABA106
MVERLLTELRRVTNYWFQAKSQECFELLIQICTQILEHGLAEKNEEPDTDHLINDFEFLLASQQKVSTGPTLVHGKCQSRREFFHSWITRCLQARCLVECLQNLVADNELMECYYQRANAFLHQPGPSTTLFVCLLAIQLNQKNLLSQLERNKQLRHRRTSSQPNFSISPRLKVVLEEEHQQPQAVQEQPPVRNQRFLRRLKSLPNLLHDEEDQRAKCRRSQTFSIARTKDTIDSIGPSTSAGSYQSTSTTISTSSRASSSSSSPTRIEIIDCDDIKIWTDQSTTPHADIPVESEKEAISLKHSSPLNNFLSNLFGSHNKYTTWFQRGLGEDNIQHQGAGDSVLDTFLPVNGRKLQMKQTLFEGVSMLHEAAAAAAAPPPIMLTTTTATSEPLDILGQPNLLHCTESNSSSYCSMASGSNNSNMDEQSLATFLQFSQYAHNNTELEKENNHFRISEACIQAIEQMKWTKTSIPSGHCMEPRASSSSYSNIRQSSAEAVGLQLISRFNNQHLPKVGHLKWLVLDQDTPQQLLPMPKLSSCSGASLQRGTKTWAPPRQQIIFTEHPPLSRSELLQLQNYRCAGCGMHVERQYQHHFRYCTYLGKYLCTGCHRQQISAIPSKILQSWDFRCYPVSTFAYRLIEQMYSFPLFNVQDLNPQLYGHSQLTLAFRRRVQLRAVKRFIEQCRFATREQTFFNVIPEHLTQNCVDLWSMCDLVDVRNGSMTRSIEELIELSEKHVYNCVLCTGRAFVCEHCRSNNLIYPWHRKIRQCGECGIYWHQSCWKLHKRIHPHVQCTRCSRWESKHKPHIESD